MSFDFSGHVLRGPRVATTNSPTTAEPTNGVVRDVRPVPDPYSLKYPEAPGFVDAWADQYRAAVLEAPGTTPTEYLFWAENSSSLSLVDDPSWWHEDGTGKIPTGTLEVTNLTPVESERGTYSDGSSRIIVTDWGGRSLSSITWAVVARGDVDDYDDGGWVDPEDPSLGRIGSNPYLVLDIDRLDQDASAGVINLTESQLLVLDGGLSNGRGDQVVTVRYTLAPARFWWTRNDRYETRFGFNKNAQRWEPYKGSSPKNLGPLKFDEVYTLSPRVSRLPVGSFLPGDSGVPDSYSMLRLGVSPNSLSTPVGPDSGPLPEPYLGIQVRADDEIDDFDFTVASTLAGVVGQGSGVLRFNPTYINLHAGKTLWYVYTDFQEDADGIVGKLGSDPLFIAPIPGPTDRPILRIGTRRDMSVIVVPSDILLALAIPAEGQVAVSLSTGQLKFSQADILKADPTSATFDKHYLGEQVIYAGVSLNRIPQPTKAPTRLIDSGGSPGVVGHGNTLYVPDSVSLPDDFTTTDPYRGLGHSGVMDVPDGTGAIPSLSGTPAPSRPGGDAISDPSTGRVRQVLSSVGDTMVFGRKGLFKNIEVVQTTKDLLAYRSIPEDTICIAKEYTGSSGSQVAIGASARTKYAGDTLYFLQAELTPAIYTDTAEVYARNRYLFRFNGDETLYFAINGTIETWQASSLPVQDFYTPQDVAASLNDAIVGAGEALVLNGRLCLKGITSVEIGWGAGGVKDLSGASVLGFLPGWRAQNEVANWLPDSGVSLGLHRSPVNLDRNNATADFQAEGRVADEVLVEHVSGQPFVFLTQPPLQDVAGYDQNVFFNLAMLVTQEDTVQIVQKPLRHYEDIQHRFGESKFAWLEGLQHTEVVSQPLTTLALGQVNVVPETLLNATGIRGGLYVAADGGRYELLEQGEDYILPGGGQQGYALLTEQFGARVVSGALGSYTSGAGTFSDLSADFSSVQPGYRLKLTSGSEKTQGSYIVLEVVDSTTLLVEPPFLEDSDKAVTWEIYKGYTKDVFDPGLVADVVFEEFQHLQEEPFRVRVLTPLGVTPTSATDQEKSRLNANIAGAVEGGRLIGLRFGLEEETSDNTAALYELGQEDLGVLANDVLLVPETDHFSTSAFSIKIGSEKFPQGLTLVGVSAFSSDPGSGNGIEYLTADWAQPGLSVLSKGTLRFGSNILTSFDSSHVYYFEEFRDPSGLPLLVAEYNRHTGDLNIGQQEIDTFGAIEVYFVEQMVTKSRKDVTLSPMTGAFSFNTPLSSGQVVEAQYFKADLDGRKVGSEIIEFLPVFIRDETAERQSGQVFTFNSDMKTIDKRFEPLVYVGSMQQNFGPKDYNLEYLDDGRGQVTFISKVLADYIDVSITYSVFEANGGERSYDAGNHPVYRPPFFIKENTSEFGLRGDRTADFTVGQMLRVGESCFYISELKYYPPRTDIVGGKEVVKGDVTGVGIFPPTIVEVGSRSPGNDLLSLVTDRPIALEIDPDGGSPVASTGAIGFWQDISLEDFPFEPVNRGQATITFRGNLTGAAVPGHILEASGKPYTIALVELSQDGTRTRLTLASPFLDGLSVSRDPIMRISYRPVYPQSALDIIGSGPAVPTEPVELVLFGETDAYGNRKPGRTLVPNLHYSFNAGTGAIQLLEPFQGPLLPGQSLYLSFTRQKTLAPFFDEGVAVTPRYLADFRFNTFPTAENGFLDGRLTATYSFRNPDTFYTRVLSLRSYLGEAVEDALKTITSQTPAGGALVVTTGGGDNWEYGRVGLRSERRNLEDLDRSARVFLDFYNKSIVTFEQILETVSGGVIGDRDGKLRFFLGRGKEYAPPGYEDEITGGLNPRNVFSFVLNSSDPNRDITFRVGDNVVSPVSAFISNGRIDGTFMDVSALDQMVNAQALSILNDIDDVVLTGVERPAKIKTPGIAPYFRFQARGQYERMADNHFFSRLFPRSARAFFTTYPGIGADGSNPGVYTAGRDIGGKEQFTAGKTIGRLSNPGLGDITEVANGSLSKRRARARIWGYFPGGLPSGAFNLGTPSSPVASPALSRPVLIVTSGFLRDLPINPATGYPDHTKFLSQGGELPDAMSGDPDLAVPGFQSGDQIGWGQPDGNFYAAYNGSSLTSTPAGNLYEGILVDEVLYGCVVTLKSISGTPLFHSNNILVGTSPSSGVSAETFPIVQGDTLRVVPTSLSTSFTGAPTLTTLKEAAEQSDNFRLGFDLDIRQDGSVIDLSLPSFEDPSLFGVKEILAQNSPKPFESLEGEVQFVYTSQNPYQFPALQGLERDDDGDFQIPFLKTANTELDRFGEASAGLALVMTSVGTSGGYVYPDEIVGTDGSILGSVSGSDPPAALLTSQDFLPITAGSMDKGIADVREYDLLLMEVGQVGGVPSLEGVLSVGFVGHHWVEPPRFITATTPPSGASNQTGSPVQYSFDNAITFLDPGGYPDPQVNPVAGVLITEVTTAIVTTTFDFSSLGFPPEFADGLGNSPATGGLNDIYSADTNNIITIELIRRTDPNSTLGTIVPDGAVEMTITIQGNTVTANPGGSSTLASVSNPLQFGSSLAGAGPSIQIQTDSAWLDFNAPSGQEADWYLPYQSPTSSINETLYGVEYKISVDTQDPGKSITAYVSTDRLTFNEVLDLRHMQERGVTHPLNASTSMETRLVVRRVTVGGGILSDVNEGTNGGSKYTFLARPPLTGPTPPDDAGLGLGTWTGAVTGVSPERGTARVMGFEGYHNMPLLTNNFVFSAIPSSDEYASGGDICTGTGKTESKANTNVPNADRYDDRIAETTVVSGSLLNIEPGDVLTVEQSSGSAHLATHKAGSYLVHHAVEDNTGAGYQELSPSTIAGVPGGWSNLFFTQVVEFVPGPNPLDPSSLIVGSTFGYPATGRVYIIRSLEGIKSGDVDIFKHSVVSALYTGISGNTFTGVGGFALADGVIGGLTNVDFGGLVTPGLLVSGRERFPVDFSPFVQGNLKSQNLVGWEGAGATKGFYRVTFYPPEGFTGASPLPLTGADVDSFVPPSASRLGVRAGTVPDNGVFNNDPNRILYPDVPVEWGFSFTPTQWKTLNIPASSWGFSNTVGIDCILPGTRIDLADEPGTTAGLHIQSGVFLEPSFPRQVFDLSAGGPHIVDGSHSLTAGEIGMRNAADYLQSVSVVPEEVAFKVRRIRRFHDANNVIGKNIQPLRYAYEIRRGRITGYTTNDQQYGVVTAQDFTMDWESTKLPAASPRAPDVWNDGGTFTGTNLGGFTDPDVNIHPGDVFRVLDGNGDVIEEATITSIDDDATLRLGPPGLVKILPLFLNQRFEIFLRQAPVPHEQSNEQLLDLITDKVVYRTFADDLNETGGYVPADIAKTNRLYDDLNAPGGGGTDFGGLGVRRGDIVIVDPLGTNPLTHEAGAFPLGDTGLIQRAYHAPGGPDPLDDNRGWYRIIKVVAENGEPPYLEVSPETTFTGVNGGDVVFPGDPALVGVMGYAVYPTVTNSGLTTGTEGQMDLRPTEVSQGGSYATDSYSIRPFSYRVIRPSSLFSDQAIDLVLCHRERVLSMLQLYKGMLTGSRSGDYFLFQRDLHAQDLGDPVDFLAGVGVLTNAFIDSIVGEIDKSPYYNSSSALAFHDRRFWLQDSRLDSLVPESNISSRVYDPGVDNPFPLNLGPYTAYTDDTSSQGSEVLPVLPGRIDEILDAKDRLRPIRYTWLSYRTHRILGTLASMDRFDKELESRLEKQQRLLDIQTSVESET